jgi:hypothetical protein
MLSILCARILVIMLVMETTEEIKIAELAADAANQMQLAAVAVEEPDGFRCFDDCLDKKDVKDKKEKEADLPPAYQANDEPQNGPSIFFGRLVAKKPKLAEMSEEEIAEMGIKHGKIVVDIMK